MAGKQSSSCPTEQTTPEAAELLQAENDRLIHELRAFVSVALQHGLQDYCETRHPALTAEIRSSQDKSQVGARKKYANVLARISQVPGLQGVNERLKVTRFQRLILTRLLGAKAPRRTALI